MTYFIMGYSQDEIEKLIFKDIEQKRPKQQYLSLKILNWKEEYGEVHIYDTPEGLEVWIGGMFRYRQKR